MELRYIIDVLMLVHTIIYTHGWECITHEWKAACYPMLTYSLQVEAVVFTPFVHLQESLRTFLVYQYGIPNSTVGIPGATNGIPNNPMVYQVLQMVYQWCTK